MVYYFESFLVKFIIIPPISFNKYYQTLDSISKSQKWGYYTTKNQIQRSKVELKKKINFPFKAIFSPRTDV